jgi:hypothetical protein
MWRQICGSQLSEFLAWVSGLDSGLRDPEEGRVYPGLSPTNPAFFWASLNRKDIKTIYYYYYHYYLIMFSQKKWLARKLYKEQ